MEDDIRNAIAQRILPQLSLLSVLKSDEEFGWRCLRLLFREAVEQGKMPQFMDQLVDASIHADIHPENLQKLLGLLKNSLPVAVVT